jgi:hypothetical protein
VDLAIVNGSTLVSDADAATIAAALDAQLREDVLPCWDRRPCSCLWLPGGPSVAVPAGVLPLVLLDEPDVAGAGGYHDETPEGFILGKIFCGPVLRAGGGVLDGGKIGDGVSIIASHEAIEAKFDPNVNLWVDGPAWLAGKNYAQACFELCDPVQAGSYEKNGVRVSDFVTRAFFDPHNPRGPFSWLRTIRRPLTIDAGGYMIVRDQIGAEQQVFGSGGSARPWRVPTRSSIRLA